MSKKIYCIAAFKAKEGKQQQLIEVLKALEPDTHREDGCIQYTVTRHIENAYAPGESFPIVFNEIWASVEAFEAHCQKDYITGFFEKHCIDAEGLVDKYNVTVYSDEV